MSRRHAESSDSLEMLLDTMCNTFGGIILIALLIALISNEKKASESEDRRITEGGGAIERRVREAEGNLAQAQSLQAELETRIKSEGEAGALALVEERERLRKLSAILSEEADSSEALARSTAGDAKIIENIQRMSAENLQRERKLIEEKNLGASLLGRLEELKRGTQDESNRLRQIVERQTERIRLPAERETRKDHIYVILRHGRVYPLVLFRDGLPERNTATLRWTDEGEVKRVEPDPGLGLDPRTQMPALSLFLRSVPADKFYLVFQVYADSFAAYKSVKTAAAAHRLEYSWEPRREDEALRIGGGAARAARPQN